MKVTGPGSGLPPEAAGGAGQAEAPDGAGFVDELRRPEAADATAEGAGSVEGPGLVGDIAADLQAGRISAAAAIDRVIDRVLDRQVGPGAPASVRAQVEAGLREALASDPLLAEKLRRLA